MVIFEQFLHIQNTCSGAIKGFTKVQIYFTDEICTLCACLLPNFLIVAQSVAFLTADPRVASSILAPSHTFVEIDHEIISVVILFLSADSRRVVVCYKQKYVYC